MTLARAAITPADFALLPSRRDEDWRWTDLRGAIRNEIPASPPANDAVQPGGPFKSHTDLEVVIANGRLNYWPEEGESENVELFEHEWPERPRQELTLVQWAGERAIEPPVSILQFSPGPDRVALLRFVSDENATGHHARFGVLVEAGAKAVLWESYEGAAQDYFSNVLLEIFVEPGAHLERIVVAEDGAAAVSVSTALVDVAPGATYTQTILTTGAKRQRFETHVTHPGQGASVRLDGAYLVGGKRHADQTTVVSHAGAGGTTSQLTKGAVAGQGRGVFQGRIVVEKGADQTDARMGHHALILSDQAEVDAKPELLIFADDVQCAHGNTVGQLDEQAIFYARQRGIPLDMARALMTEAFVGEVIDRIEHEGARDIARAWATEELREMVQ